MDRINRIYRIYRIYRISTRITSREVFALF